jgi:hypothetical protein
MHHHEWHKELIGVVTTDYDSDEEGEVEERANTESVEG